MVSKSLALFILISSNCLQADVLTNLKSLNRVKILKVLEGFETGIIEEMRKGKIVESCMRIADAHGASLELKTMLPKNILAFESHLLLAKSNCSDLDQIKLDELYLKQLSRHLNLARLEFNKL